MPRQPLVQLYPLREGSLLVFDGDADYETLLAELANTIDDQADRFRGDSLLIDLGRRNLSTKQLLELEALINRSLGRRVLQIVNEEARDILKEEGLTVPSAAGSAPREADAADSMAQDLVREARRETVDATDSSDSPARGMTAVSERLSERAQLLRRTIRSGQRVTYDGSIVVLGDVNPGAEVIAAGDIIVVGALRGVAHAGVRGDLGARIVALRLVPVQLRIAHLIGRAPDDADDAQEPEVAFVQDGRITVQMLASRSDAGSGQGGNPPWVERS